MSKKFNIPTIEEMIEAGVHFGHPKRRWNPEMEKYIYSTENNTSVIDLYQTADLLEKACDFLYEVAKNGGKIIIVGTKRQASQMVKDYAQKAGIMFVNERWLGGTFTNFKSVQISRDELKRLREGQDAGTFNHYTKKERLLIDRKIDKLELLVGGISDLTGLPQAVVVIDVKREKTAIAESNSSNVPVVGLIDTNSDPNNLDYIIPGNDDAIKAIELFLKTVTDAIIEGYKENAPRGDEKSVAKETVTKASASVSVATSAKTPVSTSAATPASTSASSSSETKPELKVEVKKGDSKSENKEATVSKPKESLKPEVKEEKVKKAKKVEKAKRSSTKEKKEPSKKKAVAKKTAKKDTKKKSSK